MRVAGSAQLHGCDGGLVCSKRLCPREMGKCSLFLAEERPVCPSVCVEVRETRITRVSGHRLCVNGGATIDFFRRMFAGSRKPRPTTIIIVDSTGTTLLQG